MLDPIITTLRERNEIPTAIALLETMTKYARTALEYDALGKAYNDLNDYHTALMFVEKALKTAETEEVKYNTRINIAKLYNKINEPEKALMYLEINQKINPNDPDVLLELTLPLFLLGRKAEGEKILYQMLEDKNISDEVRTRVEFNLGTHDLCHDNFERGMRRFLLSGKKMDLWKRFKLPQTFWEGGVVPGRTIVIVAEGGIGDEIIDVRFMDHLRNFGMKPIWYTTRQDLARIFNSLGYTTVTKLEQIPHDALWTYSMPLPVYLGLTPQDLWKGPYIKPAPEYQQKWAWMKKSGKVRVGVRWAGNNHYEQNLHRTLPLREVYNVLKGGGYELYSLQRDEDLEQLKDFPDIIDLSEKLESFEDTLAVMDNLDFVVTSCTSVLHAASAMDKKVYALVPISTYYTWCSSDEYHSAWYGKNLTILRQSEPKSWDQPLAKLKDILYGVR